MGARLPNDPAGRLHRGVAAEDGLRIWSGVTQAAAGALRWWAGICGSTERDLLDELQSQGGAPPGAAAPSFAPYLAGSRTPHLDAAVRGGFVGLQASHSRPQLTRAVLEGVAFELRDAVEIMRALGAPVESALISGGGGRHPAWRRALADGLGLPLELPRGEAGWETARGAALLAGRGAGAIEDLRAPGPDWFGTHDTCRPRVDTGARYRRWKHLYRPLSEWARAGGSE